MADQVNLTVGLATGVPSQLLAASGAKPAPERPRPAKTAPPETSTAPDSKPAVRSAGASEAAMERVNDHLQQTGSELQFQQDRETGRTIYKVVNPKTGEVVIQIPSEEMLALARNVRALEKEMGAAGVLMDKEG